MNLRKGLAGASVLVLVGAAVVVAACVGPEPTVSDCPAPLMQCGASCTNTSIDNNNCGACGNACSSTQFCVKGACLSFCPNGNSECTGPNGPYCVNEQTDNANCGGCGNACPEATACSGGKCVSRCTAPETLCMPVKPDGGTDAGDAGVASLDAGPTGPYCANTQTDRANCGACGSVCPVHNGIQQGCVNGTCTPYAFAFVPGNEQTWIVPITGTYLIQAMGGAGGPGGGPYPPVAPPGGPGGNPAIATGRFALTAGTELTIMTATAGSGGWANSGGGGGGGSFVVIVAADGGTPTLLVAAGGGGGGAGGGCTGVAGGAGSNASTTTAGVAGTGGNDGGTNGSGGAGDAVQGSGGGGFLTNGGGCGGGGMPGPGGNSFLNGGAPVDCHGQLPGGFGGGATGYFCGGGGGGYSGGGAGHTGGGGGGGSYVSPMTDAATFAIGGPTTGSVTILLLP